jgi:hypothetical protein
MNGVIPPMKAQISIDRRIVKHLMRLIGLFLTLAIAPQVLLAQDWDHLNGRDKIHDPTGVWLWNTSLSGPDGQSLLLTIDFHAGGTLTQDVQGEAAFDPSAVPASPTESKYNNNVISSPDHGVWQKTGWNTFAATLLDIQYHVSTNPVPGSPVMQFGMLQYSGRLTGSGDTMEITGRETHYKADGTQTDHSPFKANGIRIPLTILPNTIQKLRIPAVPQ